MKQMVAVILLLSIICFPICTIDEMPVKVPEKKIDKAQKIIIKEITAYCDRNLMANGERTHPGAIAASRSIPFGTKIRIAGKIYVVKDRLSRRYDNRIDIWMPKQSDCIAWGIRKMRTEIIKN